MLDDESLFRKGPECLKMGIEVGGMIKWKMFRIQVCIGEWFPYYKQWNFRKRLTGFGEKNPSLGQNKILHKKARNMLFCQKCKLS